MKKKTVFYSDPLNDDFALSKGKIKKKKIDDGYRFQHKSFVYKLLELLIYRCIATPLVFLYMKVVFGLKISNKKAVRNLKGGFFLYGNHTQNVADAFIPSLISFPRKNHIITSPETVSIPVIRFLTPMLGALPLPSTVRGAMNFNAAVTEILRKRRVITVYPEAHIWPFCNFIRPFRDDAFDYPVRHRLPVVPFTVTYRKRKFLEFLHPHITVCVGEPVYPDLSMGSRDARKKLRNQVFNEMERAASSPENEEYIAYRPANEEEPAAAECEN